MTDREPQKQSENGYPGMNRRMMMKVLGTGAALSTMSVSAFAQSQGENSDLVRPGFGYAALATQEPPVEPNHEVALDIRPPSSKFKQGQLFFNPTGLAIEPGDTVQFTVQQETQTMKTKWYDPVWANHTVSSYDPVFGYKRRVPQNAPTISSPVLWPETYFLYTFAHEGVYDLNCLPHEGFGMVIRIVSGAPTGPAAEPISAPEQQEDVTLSPPSSAAAKILGAPALQPERIIEAGRVNWDEIPLKYKK